MKIIVDIIGVFREQATDDLTKQRIKRRRYDITNAEDIPSVLSQMAKDIEFQIEKIEQSGETKIREEETIDHSQYIVHNHHHSTSQETRRHRPADSQASSLVESSSVSCFLRRFG